MTGIFKLYINYKHKKNVEMPHEVLEELLKWWTEAKQDSEFKIRCELPT